MPEDLMELYCRRVCGNLRSRINAEIYVNSDKDDMVIDIYWGEFQYQQVFSQMYKLVYRGISTDNIADFIYNNYRQKLLQEAFI